MAGYDLRERSFKAVLDDILTPNGVKVGGFPEDIFVSITEEEKQIWLCNICYMIVNDARECDNSHLFCHTCIFAWSLTFGENSQKCPFCRNNQASYRENTEVIRKIQEKHIKCPEDKCGFKAPLKVFLMHSHGRQKYDNSTVDLERLRPARSFNARILLLPMSRSGEDGPLTLRSQLQQGREMIHQMMLLLHLEMQLRQQAVERLTTATTPIERLHSIDEVLALNEQLSEVGTVLTTLLSVPILSTARDNSTRRRIGLLALSRNQNDEEEEDDDDDDTSVASSNYTVPERFRGLDAYGTQEGTPRPPQLYSREAALFGRSTYRSSQEDDDADEDDGDSDPEHPLVTRRLGPDYPQVGTLGMTFHPRVLMGRPQMGQDERSVSSSDAEIAQVLPLRSTAVRSLLTPAVPGILPVIRPSSRGTAGLGMVHGRPTTPPFDTRLAPAFARNALNRVINRTIDTTPSASEDHDQENTATASTSNQAFVIANSRSQTSSNASSPEVSISGRVPGSTTTPPLTANSTASSEVSHVYVHQGTAQTTITPRQTATPVSQGTTPHLIAPTRSNSVAAHPRPPLVTSTATVSVGNSATVHRPTTLSSNSPTRINVSLRPAASSSTGANVHSAPTVSIISIPSTTGSADQTGSMAAVAATASFPTRSTVVAPNNSRELPAHSLTTVRVPSAIRQPMFQDEPSRIPASPDSTHGATMEGEARTLTVDREAGTGDTRPTRSNAELEKRQGTHEQAARSPQEAKPGEPSGGRVRKSSVVTSNRLQKTTTTNSSTSSVPKKSVPAGQATTAVRRSDGTVKPKVLDDRAAAVRSTFPTPSKPLPSIRKDHQDASVVASRVNTNGTTTSVKPLPKDVSKPGTSKPAAAITKTLASTVNPQRRKSLTKENSNVSAAGKDASKTHNKPQTQRKVSVGSNGARVIANGPSTHGQLLRARRRSEIQREIRERTQGNSENRLQ